MPRSKCSRPRSPRRTQPRSLWLLLATFVVLFGACLPALAEEAQNSTDAAGPVYVIFDASGSMWGQLPDGVHKIEAARQALRQLGGDFGARELALRMYGHRREGDCADTEMVVPFGAGKDTLPRIQSLVDGTNPKGKTPIARSLRAALEDFGARAGEGGEIILISDGVETCDEDPCALVRAWAEHDVRIRVHVVGLGLSDVERQAMQCISDAAGTEYRDAGSAEELAASLSAIHESSGGPSLRIVAVDQDGEAQRVVGRLMAADGKSEALRVTSHRYNQVEPGAYRLEVGIETKNGTLHRPVTREVTVADHGATTVHVEVVRPATVAATFLDEGEETRGRNITAFRDGEEVFHFRWMDRVFVDAGAYTFRSGSGRTALETTLEVVDGKDHEITFTVPHTVHAKIRMVATGSGLHFRQNYELWQGGALVEKVHMNNGVHAAPGVYDLRLPSDLTPYVHRGLELADVETQDLVVEIPAGHLTVIYQKADGTRNKDERVRISRVEGDQLLGRKMIGSGTQVPLTEGTYELEGWSRMGTFDLVRVEIVPGEDVEVVLRSKD